MVESAAHLVDRVFPEAPVRQWVLTSLQDLYDQVSRSYVMDLFFMTKSDELKSIFLDSPLAGQAYDVLTSVDPANLASYDYMIK
jgi:hypothetical protein